MAKLHAKREHEAKKEGKPKRGRGYPSSSSYGRGYSTYNAYPRHSAPAAQGWAPQPQAGAPPALTYQQRMQRKQEMRCNNCAEFGHFSRECNKPPLPPPK